MTTPPADEPTKGPRPRLFDDPSKTEMDEGPIAPFERAPTQARPVVRASPVHRTMVAADDVPGDPKDPEAPDDDNFGDPGEGDG